MKPKSKKHGSTLIELLIGSLITLLIGAMLIMFFLETSNARSLIMEQSFSEADTRLCLDLLSNRIRNAQMVSGSGAFSAASSNSITCYNDSTGTNTTCYWLDTTTTPGVLKQTATVGASPATTTILLTDVQSIQFTYYVISGSTFTASSTQWATTAAPTAPTASELPNLGAVGIVATVNNGGYTSTIRTFVRLRNSPAKTHI